MLNTFVTHARVVEFEPRLADYLATGQTDYSTIIEKAKEVLTQGLKMNGMELKKLCIPLVLQSSADQTVTKTGDKSVADSFERRIWYINLTAQTGDMHIFTLQGTNDNTSETWTTTATQTLTDTGEANVLFDDVYSYYRVNWVGTTATYSSNLYEESFYLAHVWKALEMIYVSHQKVIGTIWESKAAQYLDLYEKQIKNIKFTYDYNGDQSVTSGESFQTYRPSFSR